MSIRRPCGSDSRQLILSAGINANQYGEDADGIDRHFGVNWLGHYYAINQLWPLLRKTSKMPDTPAPRIVMESSENHRMTPSNVHFGSLSEINDPSVGPTYLYGRSKLAMILGVKYGLVERVIKPNGDNIYALAVHPGAVSNFVIESFLRLLNILIGQYRHAGAVGVSVSWPHRQALEKCDVHYRKKSRTGFFQRVVSCRVPIP